MNLMQFGLISGDVVDRNILPAGSLDMDTDNGAEADPCNINSLVSILVRAGYWGLDENDENWTSGDTENDGGAGFSAHSGYIRMFDGRPGERGDMNWLLGQPMMRYIVLNLQVTSYQDGNVEGTARGHFVPLVRFGDFWLLLGGEKRCCVCKIMHSDITDYLLTEKGRSLLLEKCQVPFGEEKVVDFQSVDGQGKSIAFMPVKVLKEPVSHDHLTDDEIKRITPWDYVASTGRSFKKVSFRGRFQGS